MDSEIHSGLDLQEYMMLLHALCSAVPPEMVSMVMEHKIVKEA